MKADFLYDYHADILYVYKDSTAHGSVELGPEIVLDFDKQGNVVAVEFLEASKILSALSQRRITKKMLSTVQRVALDTESRRGLLFVAFSIFMQLGKPIKEKLNLQDIHYESPVLARTA